MEEGVEKEGEEGEAEYMQKALGGIHLDRRLAPGVPKAWTLWRLTTLLDEGAALVKLPLLSNKYPLLLLDRLLPQDSARTIHRHTAIRFPH